MHSQPCASPAFTSPDATHLGSKTAFLTRRGDLGMRRTSDFAVLRRFMRALGRPLVALEPTPAEAKGLSSVFRESLPSG